MWGKNRRCKFIAGLTAGPSGPGGPSTSIPCGARGEKSEATRLYPKLRVLLPSTTLGSTTSVTYRFQHCRLTLLSLQPPGSMGSLRETHM